MPLELQNVLNEPRRAMHFHRFLKSIDCAETLAFLYAVRQLNPLLGPATLPTIPPGEPVDHRPYYVYERFIAGADEDVNFNGNINSTPRRVPVNLPSHVGMTLVGLYKARKMGANSFDDAYNSILKTMELDSWKKFNDVAARSFWDNNDLRGFIQHKS